MSNMTSFQELSAHLAENNETHTDEDFSDGEDISDMLLVETIQTKDSQRQILVSDDLSHLHKSGEFGYVLLNASNVSTNSTGNNYFSFQQSAATGAHSLLSDASHRSHRSLRSHSLSPNANSSPKMRQLPQTDFAPRNSRLKYNASSWFELLRMKYLLFLISYLSFVAIVTFFLIPRAIDAWIEVTVQKLQFPTRGQLNIQMSITGYLYVTNPNYLPIILESMKVDVYFNRTTHKHYNHDNKTIDICQQIYLLSFTNSWHELQNEETYDYYYPFSVTLNQNISNKTLSQFTQYVSNSCKASGSYILRAQIYPQYEYSHTIHQIAFYTDTHANQGCQPNKTTASHKQ